MVHVLVLVFLAVNSGAASAELNAPQSAKPAQPAIGIHVEVVDFGEVPAYSEQVAVFPVLA